MLEMQTHLKLVNTSMVKPTEVLQELKLSTGTLYTSKQFQVMDSSAEKIEGREGLQTATVLKYKENSILANNRLLDYSDIDHTTEDFIQYFQKDFIPSLDLANIPNKRTVIKHIKDLYQKKGTEESVKFLMRVLYQDDAEVRYPINETMFVSDSSYSQQRRMVVKMDREVLPKVNDKITKYKTDGSIDAGRKS